MIVLSNEAKTLGLLAQEILGVRRVPLGSLQAPLPTLQGKRREYLKGITAEGTAVLEGEKLLGDESLVVNDQ